MTDALLEFLVNFPDELKLIIISMFPVVELRGGLIVAATLMQEMHWLKAFILCVIGNMIPIPFILFFIKKIFEWFKKLPFLSKMVTKLEAHANKKGADVINKYKLWGLFFLVAIPLPGTGGWTGALVASIFNIRIKHSFPVIFVGVAAAGVIMLVLSYFIPGLFF